MKDFFKTISELKKKNKKIVFTNGCFDIIHAGHIKLLREAKEKGDILVVGINSDESVRRLKGPFRPLMPLKQRVQVLSSIKYVDFVVVFKEDTPYKLIKKISPDVLVKGSDYEMNEIVGRDLVDKTIRVKVLSGVSTSKIFGKIFRILDTNFNRASEGLRVIEDSVRFILGDEKYYKNFRRLRHEIANIATKIHPKLIQARNSKRDIGKNVKEKKIENIHSLVLANFRRVEEALRVLEDYSRLVSTLQTSKIKKIRFKIYDIEKEIIGNFQSL